MGARAKSWDENEIENEYCEYVVSWTVRVQVNPFDIRMLFEFWCISASIENICQSVSRQNKTKNIQNTVYTTTNMVYVYCINKLSAITWTNTHEKSNAMQHSGCEWTSYWATLNENGNGNLIIRKLFNGISNGIKSIMRKK